ncbi:MAG: DMT family transporter [Pseudomonadota bacterium]|nr:DMT family transporter [Pseudomonadota bacterium]
MSTLRDDPLRGVALVLASTLFLACSDATAKYLAASLPIVAIAWLRYLGFSLIMLAAVLAQAPAPVRSAHPGLQVLRGIGLVSSVLLFISSLRDLPVADASAITFVSPIFIAALSIPLLGETVGWRRWIAALIGLVGVLVIIRPGTSAFQPAAILPVLSSLSWAGTVIVTRKMSGTDSAVTTLTYSAAVGMVVLTLLLPFHWAWPQPRELALGAFVGLASTVGHWLVVLAYRYGAASALAPFHYSQLLWATLFGFGIFGAVPDLWTFAGAGLIVASGLAMAYHERTRSRQDQSRPEKTT